MTDARLAALHDPDAEAAMLGAMMLSRPAIEVGAIQLLASDFYVPWHRELFVTLVERYRTGIPVDPVAVAADLAGRNVTAPQDGWRTQLLRVQAETPSSANVTAYADIILDRSQRRELLSTARELAVAANDLSVAVGDTVDHAKVSVEGVGRTILARQHLGFQAWSKGIDMNHDWLVPGIFEKGERAILVAKEGVGKSLLLRQWALQIACGIHWFTGKRIAPHSTIVIDVENSPREIVRGTKEKLIPVADRVAPNWNDDNFVIIPYMKLDLNQRIDRLDVEAYLLGHHPDLVVLGPLYKIFQPDSRHTYEEAALRAQRVIDDWRSRFGFAVLIEAHAAKGSSGSRDLDPRGSAAWLAWPNYGLSLTRDADDRTVATLGHFRGQRELREWPTRLREGGRGQWPWLSADTGRY